MVKTEKGQIVESIEIKAAYDKAIGHIFGSGQIYYFFIVMTGAKKCSEASILILITICSMDKGGG